MSTTREEQSFDAHDEEWFAQSSGPEPVMPVRTAEAYWLEDEDEFVDGWFR